MSAVVDTGLFRTPLDRQVDYAVSLGRVLLLLFISTHHECCCEHRAEAAAAAVAAGAATGIIEAS
jgi:hypothetical protein